MNQILENKQSMYIATQEVCITYNAVWSATPAFSTNFTSFQSKIAEIELVKGKQEINLKGIAQDKYASRVVLVDKAMVIIGAINAYALVSANNTLKEEVNYTRSKLISMRDTDLVTANQIVLAKANENVLALADYGITPVMITDYDNVIRAFDEILQDPRAAISDRKGFTESLEILFKDADAVLEILDSIVEIFKPGSPDFYRAYHAARIIVDLGIRHKPTPEPPPEPTP